MRAVTPAYLPRANLNIAEQCSIALEWGDIVTGINIYLTFLVGGESSNNLLRTWLWVKSDLFCRQNWAKNILVRKLQLCTDAGGQDGDHGVCKVHI